MNIQILKKDSKKGFRKLTGINRDTFPAHIAKLKNSISVLGMVQPIIVAEMSFITGRTETYIIEGQHKYEACMALGIDIPYTVIKNITTYEELINAMALLNSSSKSWGITDFVNAWASLYSDYKKLMVYSNKYSVELLFTANILGGYNVSTPHTKAIKAGTFKISNEEQNLEILSYVSDAIKEMPRMHRNNFKNFITCYVNMVRDLKTAYKHTRFMSFLKKQKHLIPDVTSSMFDVGIFLQLYTQYVVKSEMVKDDDLVNL